MAKKNLKKKNTIGAEGGIDLEMNNASEGKISWNNTGRAEQILKAIPDRDSLIYQNFGSTGDGNEEELIHTGNIDKHIKQDKNWEHVVSTPSTEIVINHPLGKKVSIEFIDTAGTKIRPSITKNDGLQVIIKSNVPIAGTAILN